MAVAEKQSTRWVQPDAYITDGLRLYQVLEITDSGAVRCENCVTEKVSTLQLPYVLDSFRLVRHACAT